MRTERQTAKRHTVDAALSVADEVAKGLLDPLALDVAAADECRALFGMVVGPADPLWELQVDVARQVLSLDGVPADELAEWLAVRRSTEEPRGPSWIEQALAALADEERDGVRRVEFVPADDDTDW